MRYVKRLIRIALAVNLVMAFSLGNGSAALAQSSGGGGLSVALTPIGQPAGPADLTGTLSVNTLTASAGTKVTFGLSVTNTSSFCRAVTLTTSVQYVSPTGQILTGGLSFPLLPGDPCLPAGQTFARTLSFIVPQFMPPGTYNVRVTATDVTGTIAGSVPLTIPSGPAD